MFSFRQKISFDFFEENIEDELFSMFGGNNEDAFRRLVETNSDMCIHILSINNQTLLKIRKTIENLCKFGYKSKGKLVSVKIEGATRLSIQELEILMEIEDYLKSIGAQLKIQEKLNLFTIEEIITANSKIDSLVNHINSLTVPTENNRPLNEFEKFLLAYDFCTNFKYKENKRDNSKSRNVISVLNGNSIVCVGYASLLEEICRRLDIECYSMTVTSYLGVEESDLIEDAIRAMAGGNHRNNIVVLDDKIYYADACWDSVTGENWRKSNGKGKGLKKYNHCLIPISDRRKLSKGRHVEYDDTFSFLDNIEKELGEIDVLIKLLESKKLHKNDFDRYIRKYSLFVEPGAIRTIRDAIEYLNIVREFLKKNQQVEPIGYEKFEQALINIYLAKGKSLNEAQELVKKSMDYNFELARELFNDEATNCFAVEARRREEDLEL